MRTLLHAGADANCENGRGITPLYIAIVSERIHAIELLLEYGANVNHITYDGYTPLTMAIRHGKTIIEIHIRHGAEVHYVNKIMGLTPLDEAFGSGLIDIAVLLLESGCLSSFENKDRGSESQEQISKPELDQEKSVLKAALLGDTEQIRCAFHDESRKKHSDASSCEFHLAAVRGWVAIIAFLLDNGLDVNHKDLHGRTALHHAAIQSQQDAAFMLIERGSSVSIVDCLGLTPLDMALKAGLKNQSLIAKHLRGSSSDLVAIKTRESIAGSWTGKFTYLS